MVNKDPFSIEDTIKLYEPIVEKLIKERKDIGLQVPEKVDIKLLFSQYTAGSVFGKFTLYINPFYYNGTKLDNKEAYMARKIGDLADQLRNLSGNLGYKHDLENMAVLFSEKSFDEFKPFYNNDLDLFKRDKNEFEIEKNNYMNYLLKIADIPKKLITGNLSNLIGHEIDHLVFAINFEDDELIKYNQLKKKLDWESSEEKKLSILEKININDLHYHLKTESSAHFFENFRKNGYNSKKLNFVKQIVKNKLTNYIHNDYIGSPIETICNKNSIKYNLNDDQLQKLIFGFNGFFEVRPLVEEQYHRASKNLINYDNKIIGEIIKEVILKKNDMFKYRDYHVENIYNEYLRLNLEAKNESLNNQDSISQTQVDNIENESVNQYELMVKKSDESKINSLQEKLNQTGDYLSKLKIDEKINSILFESNIEMNARMNLNQSLNDNLLDDHNLFFDQTQIIMNNQAKYQYLVPVLRSTCYKVAYQLNMRSENADEIFNGIQGLFRTVSIPSEKMQLATESLCKYESQMIGYIVKECLQKRDKYLDKSKRIFEEVKKDYVLN